MRLLAILLISACALGAHSQKLNKAIEDRINAFTKALDKICEDSLGDGIEKVLGAGETGTVCDSNAAVQAFTNPKSGCANTLGNKSNITVTLGVALNCSLTAGCKGSQNGAVLSALGLVQCILSSQNTLVTAVVQLLKNVVAALGGRGVPNTVTMVRFILFVLGRRLTELLCSPKFSLTGVALVLPTVVAIILIGAALGLIQNGLLSVVGLLVLILLPLILLVVIIVSLLLLGLGPGLDVLLGQLRPTLAGVVQKVLGGVQCPAGQSKPSFQNLTGLVKLPNPLNFIGLFTSLITGSSGGLGNPLALLSSLGKIFGGGSGSGGSSNPFAKLLSGGGIFG